MATIPLSKLRAYLEKKREELEEIPVAAYIILSNKVVKGTPVDTGYLRSKWTPSVGSEAYGGGPARIEAVARSAAVGSVFFLMNDTIYARPIEYASHSPQAPAGMLRINTAQWPQIVKRVVG